MGDKSWEELQRENPVNANNAALYDRMLACEVTLNPVRRRRGLADVAWSAAWEASNQPDPGIERDDDLLSLARYVASLGGHLELRAVFEGEEVLLLREPEVTQRPGAAPTS
jgi:hypothetical protein